MALEVRSVSGAEASPEARPQLAAAPLELLKPAGAPVAPSPRLLALEAVSGERLPAAVWAAEPLPKPEAREAERPAARPLDGALAARREAQALRVSP